ncbi:MAG: glycine zipper family protein [Alphaproteobacteria bacterium]|nr:glycine zipper family protein [Alphaproteobacteria bacterium]
MKLHYFILPLLLAVTACANSGADTRPIVDRPGPNYENDLAACQELAREKDYANGDTATSALVGAGLGALIGGVTGDWAGAGIGAGIGGASGLGAGAVETQNARSNIVKRCLIGRGYRVVD